MKQLLFNLTRYACYLRRANMKKFLKAVRFFLVLFPPFFLSLSQSLNFHSFFSPLEPVSTLAFVSLSIRSAALLSYFTGRRSSALASLKTGSLSLSLVTAVKPSQKPSSP